MSLVFRRVKTGYKGIKEHYTFWNILFRYHFGFWKFITALFTQKHKIKATRMEVDEKSKMGYKQKQKSYCISNKNLSTLKKNKLSQITFEHNALLIKP